MRGCKYEQELHSYHHPMQNLQNMPNLSGVNQDGSLARYMIQARIIYKERKKRT